MALEDKTDKTQSTDMNGWANQNYLNLVAKVERLELYFPADLSDENKVETYRNDLFRTSTLAAHFNQMAFCEDFGKNSESYYQKSNEIIVKVEKLIKKLYNK